MSDVEIVEVENSAQLKRFIRYPNTLYHRDDNYVVPLLAERKAFFDVKKNPFYRGAKVKLFLAMRGPEVVGRIATCINYKHNQFHEESTGFFGFFDAPDDYDIAAKLLKVAMITLKKEGMDRMRGPMNFSTNHEIGFLVEGFDMPPTVMMPYNRPYLPQLAEKFGLKKVMDLNAYQIRRESGVTPRIEKTVERLRQRSHITLRTVRMNDYEREITLINDVYNQAWERNWGFVPMDEAEFRHTAMDMKQIIDPELVFIAEHKGRPVAFCLALPDINQALIKLNGRLFPFGLLKLLWHTKVRKTITCLRMITMGVVPEFQKRGVDSMMYVATFKRAAELGYKTAELSWILETNDLMCRAAEQMGGTLFKRYRIVEMPL